MINQFFGNNATVRNMSRVEAAPIYSQNTSCQSVVSVVSCTATPVAQQVGLGEPGRAWVLVLGGRKYVRRRRNVGAGRVTTEGRRTRQKQDDAGTYRSLAGPLVKGVESLTMNGC